MVVQHIFNTLYIFINYRSFIDCTFVYLKEYRRRNVKYFFYCWMIVLCFTENFKYICSVSNNLCLFFQVSTRETVVENNTEGTVSNRICNLVVLLINAQSCMHVVKKYSQYLVRCEFVSLCVNKSKIYVCKPFFYKKRKI